MIIRRSNLIFFLSDQSAFTLSTSITSRTTTAAAAIAAASLQPQPLPNIEFNQIRLSLLPAFPSFESADRDTLENHLLDANVPGQ